jgi:hypothetical protein
MSASEVEVAKAALRRIRDLLDFDPTAPSEERTRETQPIQAKPGAWPGYSDARRAAMVRKARGHKEG